MRIILLATLIVINLYSTSLFAGNCLLKGEWMPMMPTKSTGGLVFEQEGNKVWVKPIPNPHCGEARLEGTTDGVTFNLHFYMTNPEPEACQFSYHAYGTFSFDCRSAEGKILMHNPGHQDGEMPFKWYRNLIKITTPDPANELVISAEPKMPDIQIKAVHKKPDLLAYLSSLGTLDTRAPAYTWHVTISHDTIPGKLHFETYLDDAITNLASYKPNFNLLKNKKDDAIVKGGVMGGELKLSVEYYNAVKDERTYIIKGTNPGRVAIDQVLTDTVTRQIACQESRYLQFHAAREGGVGFPEVGIDSNHKPTGGVGIMQLYKPKPTAAQTWNWLKNINGGLNLIELKRIDARTLPNTELGRLNVERKENGLPLCKRLPALSKKELERETLRRYNGGREHRWEPRDSLDCSGQWVVKPELPPGADQNYVEKVFACKLD